MTDRTTGGRPVRVAILGFGTVGRSLARILWERAPQDVELCCVFNRGIERKRLADAPSSVRWTDNFADVLASRPEIVIEVAGGLEPAGEWIRKSLAAGKSVVTANKKLIAVHGPALEMLAREHGCQLLYGAAVAGGVPVIPGVRQGLAGDRIESLRGILNGTCNFILSNMEAGLNFDIALKQAQERGYAEADPTEDVDGFDARAKLVILSRLGLRMEVQPEEIACRTIRDLSALDFAYARDLQCTIRQISRAEVRHGELLATVGPMLVPQSSPLSWSRGTENMVISGGQYGGEIVFSGHGAGGNPTAVAVLSDVLAIAHGGCLVNIASSRAKVDSDFIVPHYIRFVVDDQPGIIAHIAGHLAEQQININAILQKPGFEKLQLPFVVTVEPCRSSALKKALGKIGQLGFLQEPPVDLQMLETESAG
ncbi:MAG TPA: homoserine dehydrogenase [Acidobacteriaceae bacterium]|jgi:homoserine dehydrogenase|nr:homoserine dehydrogenase [Acidobacteriaceae bacterium]